MELLDFESLSQSSVVANCRMNRERRLSGVNSYERDLGLNIVDFLTNPVHSAPIRWIDLCCGTGRALVEASAEIQREARENYFSIEGIDLAGMFDSNAFPEILTLRVQTLEEWTPTGQYTLITCVHGLHYVGDKLAAIATAVQHLAPEGIFLANLDMANFRFYNGQAAGRVVATELRNNGLIYDAKRRLVQCRGPRVVESRLRYLGADDTAGPNYTGQPAVDSFYTR